MKKNIFLLIISIILFVTGTVFALMPKLTLKCDGQNCVMYRNYFGQIIRAKYKFAYRDVQRCEVHPVHVFDEKGQKVIKTFALRLIGDNIEYEPEWVKNDAEKLSSICWDFAKQKPIRYSDSGILAIMKNLWAVFFLIGGGLILLMVKQKSKD